MQRNAQTLSDLPYVDVSNESKASSSLRIPDSEKSRAARYDHPHAPPYFDQKHPEKSGQTRKTSFVSYNGTYDALPAKAVDVVVIGEVISEQSFLGKTGSSVYTTFEFLVNNVIKGGVLAQAGKKLLLEREGGIILFPSGEKRLEGIVGHGIPITGGKYLLFLDRVSDEPSYQIARGYAINGAHLASIDKASEAVDKYTLLSVIDQVNQELSKH